MCRWQGRTEGISGLGKGQTWVIPRSRMMFCHWWVVIQHSLRHPLFCGRLHLVDVLLPQVEDRGSVGKFRQDEGAGRGGSGDEGEEPASLVPSNGVLHSLGQVEVLPVDVPGCV